MWFNRLSATPVGCSFRWLAGILAGLLVGGIGMGPVQAQSLEQAAIKNENFVAVAVKQVGSAVIRIDTERKIIHDSPDPFLEDPRLHGFFGGPDMFPRTPQEERLRGQGSGFIIDPEGDILTNAHVVNGVDQVMVTLKDGRSFEGVVEGIDEITDLAVIKIDAGDTELPVAPLGNSSKVEVGDWAIAVGNPLGLDNTVTLGIVSTLKRSSAMIGIPNKRLEFIQTDAAINPGNSGGPLLNQQGEVIGINTAIRADATGIGFAIPINKAKEIKDRLARGERIAHPYIGVQIATLTPEIAKRNNDDPNSAMMLPEVNGVLVTRVLPHTPAAEAGIRRGDVIVQIDQTSTTAAEQLQNLVEKSQVGQVLQVKVKRSGQTQQYPIRTAELEFE